MKRKEQILFVILGGFFITNALLAEFIGIKLFSLERTFGFEPVNWTILGVPNRSFTLTAGVLLWPVVFIMTDIINEYFGKRGVRLLSYMTVGLIIYAFLMITLAINVVPADFWLSANEDITPNIDFAFQRIFSQGNWIIVASLIAFLIGQIADVTVFQWLRKYTGSSKIWLRATGSTLVSQLIDSFVVLFVAFYIGPRFSANSGDPWSMADVLSVGTVNYTYKFIIAILLTPLLYLIHYVIDAYLGKDLAEQLTREAAGETVE